MSLKFNNSSCVKYDDNYCYTSTTYVDNNTTYLSIVTINLFNSNDTSTILKTIKISRAFIDSFSPPIITIQLQADDLFYGYISSSDTVAGKAYNNSAGYSDNWEPVWYYSEKLYNDVKVQYVHVFVWNANGDDWGNCGFRAWITLDKPYYKFENGKQYIDTFSGWQYFHLSSSGWGINYLPSTSIRHSGIGPYGEGLFGCLIRCMTQCLYPYLYIWRNIVRKYNKKYYLKENII